MEVAVAYAKLGQPLLQDPYMVPGLPESDEIRQVIKKILLVALNSDSLKEADRGHQPVVSVLLAYGEFDFLAGYAPGERCRRFLTPSRIFPERRHQESARLHVKVFVDDNIVERADSTKNFIQLLHVENFQKRPIPSVPLIFRLLNIDDIHVHRLIAAGDKEVSFVQNVGLTREHPSAMNNFGRPHPDICLTLPRRVSREGEIDHIGIEQVWSSKPLSA